MSWSTLGANDWPTNNDVLDAIANSVFTLKAGQSLPANNDWITIAEANSKLNIANISGPSTDFPAKVLFEPSAPPAIYYAVTSIGYWSDESTACSMSGSTIYYVLDDSGFPSVGDQFYEFSGGVYSPLIPSGSNYFNSYFQSGVRLVAELEAYTGFILDIISCLGYQSFNALYDQYGSVAGTCAIIYNEEYENLNTFYFEYVPFKEYPSTNDIIYRDLLGNYAYNGYYAYRDSINGGYVWFYINGSGYVQSTGNCEYNDNYILVSDSSSPTQSTNSATCALSLVSSRKLYTENEATYFSVGDRLIRFDNSEYYFYVEDTAGYTSYFENGTRKWIEVNSGGYIVSKGDCTIVTKYSKGNAGSSNLSTFPYVCANAKNKVIYTDNATDIAIGDTIYIHNGSTYIRFPIGWGYMISYLQSSINKWAELNGLSIVTQIGDCSGLTCNVTVSAIHIRSGNFLQDGRVDIQVHSDQPVGSKIVVAVAIYPRNDAVGFIEYVEIDFGHNFGSKACYNDRIFKRNVKIVRLSIYEDSTHNYFFSSERVQMT